MQHRKRYLLEKDAKYVVDAISPHMLIGNMEKKIKGLFKWYRQKSKEEKYFCFDIHVVIQALNPL